MAFKNDFFVKNYFPRSANEIPFGVLLNNLFFDPQKDNYDFPIHGPNLIRFISALLKNTIANTKGLISGNEEEVIDLFNYYYPNVLEELGINRDNPNQASEKSKTLDLLSVTALFHDLGKVIRRANHPPIGSNLIRSFDQVERNKLVDYLVFSDESSAIDSKHNRFSLIASIVQHHDKFGVVSTGEGGLPLFSDILYFTSDKSKASLNGIRKNITAVMLLNLVDIASVCTANSTIKEKALMIVHKVRDNRNSDKPDEQLENDLLDQLCKIYEEPGITLGIALQKLKDVFEDWDLLIKAIHDEGVEGDRVKLKKRLFEIETNPARAIKRILRLLRECAVTTNCHALINPKFISPTAIESILVGTLGSHQFQYFSELFASVAKFDYGLKFFQTIICAIVRKTIDPNYSMLKKRTEDDEKEHEKNITTLNSTEADKLNKLNEDEMLELSDAIITLFVKIIEGILNRYNGVIGCNGSNPRRFGFQLRNLTDDKRIRNTIVEFLCIIKTKDPVALTWISDEVTLWSLD